MDTYGKKTLSLRKRHGKLKQNAAATQLIRRFAASAKGFGVAQEVEVELVALS